MIAGSALASRAISDVARRDLASEWGGPDPALPRVKIVVVPDATRRVAVRKP